MKRRFAPRRRPGRSSAKLFQANRSFHLALIEGRGIPSSSAFMEHVWIGRIGATLYEARLDKKGLSADNEAHKAIATAIENGKPAKPSD